MKLEAQGAVIIMDVVSRWNSSNSIGGNIDRNRKLIVWLEDQPERAWGAEFSSKQVINIGKQTGHQIYYMGQKNFDSGILAAADLIILNNFNCLNPTQFGMLLAILFEGRVPYIRYEHDAFFCLHRSPLCRGRIDPSIDARCKNCLNTKFHFFPRQMLMWKLFAGSVLNIFISPLQRKIHERALGKVLEPYFYLTPPIDTKHFKPIDKVMRNPEKTISMTGKIWYPNKGLKNLIRYSEKHPSERIEVYTKPHSHYLRPLRALGNVSIHPPVPYEELPGIYSGAGKVIHVPSWPEAAGRTIVEGYLCGCHPIMNDNCGVRHFDIPWNDRKASKEMIQNGPLNLWKRIDEVMDWEEKGVTQIAAG